ncbi:hypothetical protein AAVH_08420 [Aphelenchoides avenae]|nr:hypothetical protein AAVH_08420 [Aphelenchus avenae]
MAQQGGGGQYIWPNFADPRVRHERDAKPPTGGLQQPLREEREPDVGLESPELRSDRVRRQFWGYGMGYRPWGGMGMYRPWGMGYQPWGFYG